MKFQKLLVSLLILNLFVSQIYTPPPPPPPLPKSGGTPPVAKQWATVDATKYDEEITSSDDSNMTEEDVADSNATFWTDARKKELSPMQKGMLERGIWNYKQNLAMRKKVLATEAAAAPKPVQAVGKLNIPAGLSGSTATNQVPAAGAPAPKGPPPPPPVAKGPPPLPGTIPTPKAKLPPPPPPGAKGTPTPKGPPPPPPVAKNPVAPTPSLPAEVILHPVAPVAKITPPTPAPSPANAIMEELKLQQAKRKAAQDQAKAAQSQVTADQSKLRADAAQLKVDQDRLQAAKTIRNLTPAAKTTNLELELKVAKEQIKVEAERVKLLQDQATAVLAAKRPQGPPPPPQRPGVHPRPAQVTEFVKQKLERIILVIKAIKNNRV